MKKLLFVFFLTMILFSCSQSEQENQLKQENAQLQSRDDSIKLVAIKKQIAEEKRRDNEKLDIYNTKLTAAKEQLSKEENFHFLRSKAKRDEEINTLNLIIKLLQDSVDIISSRIASNEGNVNDVIPMVLSSSGTYQVPVIINDVLKMNFIFDSGSSDVSISPDVASALIKTGTVTANDFIGTATYSFADGSTATSKIFIIKKLSIGNHIVTNIRASIKGSINAPMLLGQSVQSRFGKIIIDNNTHTLKFK